MIPILLYLQFNLQQFSVKSAAPIGTFKCRLHFMPQEMNTNVDLKHKCYILGIMKYILLS
jgi:hypothetical protein